jgi:hypothetical protein
MTTNTDDDKADQSIATFPWSGIIFLGPPRTAGYDVMHCPHGTGIDEACPSVRNTNRINTGLKKSPSAPGQDRAEGLVRTDRGEGADGPWGG